MLMLLPRPTYWVIAVLWRDAVLIAVVFAARIVFRLSTDAAVVEALASVTTLRTDLAPRRRMRRAPSVLATNGGSALPSLG